MNLDRPIIRLMLILLMTLSPVTVAAKKGAKSPSPKSKAQRERAKKCNDLLQPTPPRSSYDYDYGPWLDEAGSSDEGSHWYDWDSR